MHMEMQKGEVQKMSPEAHTSVDGAAFSNAPPELQ